MFKRCVSDVRKDSIVVTIKNKTNIHYIDVSVIIGIVSTPSWTIVIAKNSTWLRKIENIYIWDGGQYNSSSS